MGRTQIPRTTEEKRQIGDRNRRLHAAAYRYMLVTFQQTQSLPTTEQLAEWLKEMGKQPRVSALLQGMLRHGWLSAHLDGYKLRNQLSQESIINALIQAHHEHNDAVFNSIAEQWQASQGRATPKAGRSKHVA